MGIPEQPQNGMNIAPDGMVYEILEDGTIKRIGKVSPDGKFEPFGGPKEGIREKDGIIYRVINGKERKIGRILPNGEIETISQRIRNEAEVSRNKVKAATIVSVCSLLAFFVALYAMQQVWKTREYDNKVKPVYSRYLDEVTPTPEGLQGYINQLDKLIKLKEVKYTENKRKIAEIINEIKAKQSIVEAKKAEDERKEQEAKEEEEKRTKAAKEEAERQARLQAASKAEQNEYNNRIKPLYEAYEKEKNPDSQKLQSHIDKLSNLKPKLKYDNNKKTVEEMVEVIKNKKDTVKAAEDQMKKDANARKEAETQEAQKKRKQYLKGRRIGNLIWSDRSSNRMNWNSAKYYCENLTEGGYTDWRLPNIDELRTTIKNCYKTETGGECKVSERSGCLADNCWYPDQTCYCDSRSNNGGYYSKLGDPDGVWLWSSSTQSDDPNFAWGVGFEHGSVVDFNRSNNYYVRCVR